jgi:uncharacterized protein
MDPVITPTQRFLPDLLLPAFAFLLTMWLERRRQSPWPRWITVPGAVLLVLGFLAALLASQRNPLGFRAMLLSGLSLIYAVSYVAAVAISVLVQLIQEWRKQPDISPLRRQILAATPALALGYGTFIGRRQFQVAPVDLRIPNLAPDLDGLRLVQLSDIHLSPYLSTSDLAWCVDLANETKPHLALITGDLITGRRDSIDDCLAQLGRLRAPTFGCNGNHESYVGAEAYTVDHAARLGMRFLRDHAEAVEFGSARINVAGVDHQWDPARYLPKARALIRPDALNLLLCHNPDAFRDAARQGWDLTLSGHMHGGQINLELAQANLNFARFVTPYVYGRYAHAGRQMYVTRGIGTVGVPLRLGAPPEVALLTLRRA